MPREETQLFTELRKKVNDREVFLLNPQSIKDELQKSMDYELISDLLRATNDAHFGIFSTLNKDNEWVRDATQAISLDQRMPHDAPVLDANNALLRCLSRLRPIDYAIDKKLGEQGKEIRTALKEGFAKLSEEILTIAQSSGRDKEKQAQIKEKEKEFNKSLVTKLHEANLTKGCDNEKDAEKLLFHYRNLSSVLSPARTLITLTYDKTARILQRETQYPVTEKTEEQKKALQELSTVKPYPLNDEKNAHTSHSMAAQEADSLFKELIADKCTALPAQARKTHLVGAKNAFIVKNELIDIEDESVLKSPEAVEKLKATTADDVLWLGRMGSPVFVGKGEKSDVIQAHTRENLDQVRQKAAEVMGKEDTELNLHVTTLNTVSPLEKQSTIIDHVYKATRQREGKQDNVSYAPTNPDGTFRALDIAPDLNFGEEPPPSGVAPLQKATRLESVAKVMLAASNVENTISVVHCASGQDRTGTAVEKTTQEWMKKRYAIKNKNGQNIESMRAEGGNAAEITTHHVHGSPGMKTDSVADNFYGNKTTFSPRVTSEFYRESAKTNKKNSVDDVDFLKQPSALAIAEYQKQLQEFTDNLGSRKASTPKELQLVDQGKNILNQIKDIATDKPEKLSSRSLNDLTQVLHAANKGLNEANDVAKELTALSQHVSGKASSGWKALGIGLLTFACAALVVAGVLAAIPSGGSSLLLSAIGATGLGLMTAVGVGAGVVAAVGVAGAGAAYYGREKELAKTVSNFKKELFDMKDRPKEETLDKKGTLAIC